MKNINREEALFKQGKYIKLEKGEVLHNSHETCKALGRVEKGKLRFSRILSSGKEIFLKEFQPGEMFAELIVFTGKKYPGWLIASEPTLIVEVKLSHLLEYLTEKEALVSYISGISRKMAHLSNTIEIMSMKTVKQKIAFFLLSNEKTEEKISTGSTVYINVTHLAGLLGCSREAASRALSEMESEKMIIRGRSSIQIIQKELLENLF